MKDELVDLLMNTGKDDDIAIIDAYGSYTYSEFKNTINQIAEEIKIQKYPAHSNIIVYIENRMQAIAAIIAIFKCELTAVPVSITTPQQLLSDIQNRVDAAGIIMCNKNGSSSYWKDAFGTLNHNHMDTVLMLFTSGTTGEIKAVELSKKALLFRIESVCLYMNMKDSDRFFIMKDYVHCSCLISEIFVALSCGVSMCLCNPRLPLTMIRKMIFRDKPTIMGLNPWILEMLCKQRNFLKYYESIKILISSGSVLHKELKKEVHAIISKAKLINVYGLTETSSRVCAQRPGDNNDFVSVGKAVKGAEIKIVKTNKDQGEIIVKSNGNMLGYYNDPKATASKLQDGWIHTGDMGYFDSEGNLVVLGRIDNLILSGSNKIDPERITKILKKYPGIEDAYTLGESDRFLGERVVSVIIYNEVFDVNARRNITQYCRKYLYPYECPQRMICVDELPRTSSGKIKKQTILQWIKKA